MANIKYLHIIRGFAAFFVVLAHAKWPFWVGGSAFLKESSFAQLIGINKLGLALALSSSNGTAMVIVFFVLSGFIISYSYKKNGWTYKQFLVNRAIRIYIPYIASALLAGLILWFAFAVASSVFISPLKDYHQRIFIAYSEGLNFSNFLKTVVFFKSERINYFGFNYVFWSLLYEMLFYLFFPLIIKYYKQLFFITSLIYPLHFFYNPLPEIDFWYIYFTEYLFYFTAGVFLFQYISTHGIELLKEKSVFRKPVLFFLLMGAFLLVISGGLGKYKDLSFLAAAIFGIACIVRIMLYGIKNTILSKFFLFLGTISYSLYLVHIPLLLLFYSLFFYFFSWHTYSSPWVHFLFAAATLLPAFLFYLLFEKLSFKLIDQHKKKLNKKQSAINFIEIKPL